MIFSLDKCCRCLNQYLSFNLTSSYFVPQSILLTTVAKSALLSIWLFIKSLIWVFQSEWIPIKPYWQALIIQSLITALSTELKSSNLEHCSFENFFGLCNFLEKLATITANSHLVKLLYIPEEGNVFLSIILFSKAHL